jgi:hypothetical protein
MRRFLPGLALSLALLASCRKTPDPSHVPGAEPGSKSAADTSAGQAPGGPARTARLVALLPCGKDSSVALYDDTVSDGDDYVRHKRIDSLASGYGYFVERTFYEGGDWLFISKATCAQTSLFGAVRFNPSHTRFAALSEDPEAGFSANGVQIVSLESGVPEMQLVDRMDVWGPHAGSWTDDSTFVAELVDIQGLRQRRIYGLRAGAWAFRDEKLRPSPSDSLPFPEVEDEGSRGD